MKSGEKLGTRLEENWQAEFVVPANSKKPVTLKLPLKSAGLILHRPPV